MLHLNSSFFSWLISEAKNKVASSKEIFLRSKHCTCLCTVTVQKWTWHLLLGILIESQNFRTAGHVPLIMSQVLSASTDAERLKYLLQNKWKNASGKSHVLFSSVFYMELFGSVLCIEIFSLFCEKFIGNNGKSKQPN